MGLPTYEAGSAAALASSLGWTVKTSGDQLVVEICPYCNSNKYKFYINDQTGLWDCKSGSCGQRGNFYSLKKFLGLEETRVAPLAQQQRAAAREKDEAGIRISMEMLKKSTENLRNDPEAWKYATETRGFTPETIDAWHIGLSTKGPVPRLTIPYMEGDVAVNVKMRVIPPAESKMKYLRIKGGKSVLFGSHLLIKHANDDRRPIYLTEGELDAISLWQQGFSPVVSTSVGANGSWKPEWNDAVFKYDPTDVYICYDNDVAGQQAAQRMMTKFADRKVVNIVLPDGVKDFNEYFLANTREDFDALIRSAEESDEPDNCVSFNTMLNKLAEQIFTANDSFSGVKSQFDDINNLIGGGYWNGQMILLTGSSGTGKTSLVLQEQYWMAKCGIPTYLICLEMPSEMMARKIIQHQYGVPVKDVKIEHVEKITKELGKIPFRYGYHSDNIEDVINGIKHAVRRYDTKLVAFDNINYFVRNSRDINAELAIVSKRLKETAVELNIPIILIAQPRKFDDHDRVIRLNDIKDTVAIVQDSDVAMLLYRRPVKERDMNEASFDIKDPHTMVLVEKARYSSGGHCTLYFDGARSNFKSLDQTSGPRSEF